MTVIWQINLQNQDPSMENIARMADAIHEEFDKVRYCRPRLIQLAHNGPGSVTGEELIKRGLPVELVSPSDWRQLVDPLNDGPTESGESCL